MMKVMMKALSKIEIEEYLSGNLKNWLYDGNYLKREFKFKSFVDAFSFMTAIALEAEKMDHHPDWSNVYNTVRIGLNTHDASGITVMDFNLAEKADKIFKKFT
jgi:4a-hydroxytetrahydrobiopterin dehydratase